MPVENDRQDPTATAQRAVDECREKGDEAALADRLDELSRVLAEQGQGEASLAAAREAVDLYRALARREPDRFRADLAMGLNNLANRLAALGRRDAAMDHAREAVARYRELVESQAEAFTPQLAMALGTLGAIQQRDDPAAASAHFAEALTRLAGEDPAPYRELLERLAEAYVKACIGAGIEPDFDVLKGLAETGQPNDTN